MAFSFTQQTGDGSTTAFPFSFTGIGRGYIRESDIHVFVDEVEVSHTLSGENQVVIEPAPAASADILIRRIMPKTTPYADFSRGNNFGQTNLNNAFLQQLYTYHELLDGFVDEGQAEQQQDIDMNGHKIVNLAEGTDAGDAINKSQLDVESAINAQFRSDLNQEFDDHESEFETRFQELVAEVNEARGTLGLADFRTLNLSTAIADGSLALGDTVMISNRGYHFFTVVDLPNPANANGYNLIQMSTDPALALELSQTGAINLSALGLASSTVVSANGVLNFAASNYSEIVVPAGEYLADSIEIQNDQSWVIDKQAKFNLASGEVSVFTATGKSNWSLSGGMLIGSGAGRPATPGTERLVMVSNCSNYSIRDVGIRDTSGYGLRFESDYPTDYTTASVSLSGNVYNINASGVGYPFGFSLHDKSRGVIVEGGTFKEVGNFISADTGGFTVKNCSVSDVIYSAVNYNSLLVTPPANPMERETFLVDSCRFIQCKTLFDGSICRRGVISNCSLSRDVPFAGDADGRILVMSGCADVEIVGCQFDLQKADIVNIATSGVCTVRDCHFNLDDAVDFDVNSPYVEALDVIGLQDIWFTGNTTKNGSLSYNSRFEQLTVSWSSDTLLTSTLLGFNQSTITRNDFVHESDVRGSRSASPGNITTRSTGIKEVNGHVELTGSFNTGTPYRLNVFGTGLQQRVILPSYLSTTRMAFDFSAEFFLNVMEGVSISTQNIPLSTATVDSTRSYINYKSVD